MYSWDVLLQIHGARLPLRAILAAMYILLRRSHHGQHRQTTSHGE